MNTSATPSSAFCGTRRRTTKCSGHGGSRRASKLRPVASTTVVLGRVASAATTARSTGSESALFLGYWPMVVPMEQ
eukprot:scaffold539_cov359-Prasinococcus_capsulatus_cf.AAC.13